MNSAMAVLYLWSLVSTSLAIIFCFSFFRLKKNQRSLYEAFQKNISDADDLYSRSSNTIADSENVRRLIDNSIGENSGSN